MASDYSHQAAVFHLPPCLQCDALFHSNALALLSQNRADGGNLKAPHPPCLNNRAWLNAASVRNVDTGHLQTHISYFRRTALKTVGDDQSHAFSVEPWSALSRASHIVRDLACAERVDAFDAHIHQDTATFGRHVNSKMLYRHLLHVIEQSRHT